MDDMNALASRFMTRIGSKAVQACRSGFQLNCMCIMMKIYEKDFVCNFNSYLASKLFHN